MLGYTPNLQNDGIAFLHRADGYWQPCDDFGTNVSIDRSLQLKMRACVWCFIAVGLETHADGDATVVGVVAMRWHRDICAPE